MTQAIRQGDVLVIACAAIPATAKPVTAEHGRFILARGEATGHHHSVAMSDHVAMFREDGSGGGLFLQVTGTASVALEHQEHTALPITPGTHRVIRQRVMQSGLARRVVD